MVVRTPTLNSLKRGFLPQIHQPLPLGRKESQQLIDAISSSFRKNLDKEHPAQSEDAATPSVNEHISSHNPIGHRPANSQQKAILNHLLLSHPQQHGPDSSPSAPAKNPFDVFDAAVAKGLMTPRRAAGFLATIRAQAVQPDSPDAQPDLTTTGAGLRVLQWLRTSGQEDGLRFLLDPVLIQKLVPFMYAEGLEEVAWTWLAQLVTFRPPVMRLRGVEGDRNAVTSHPLYRLLGAMMKEHSQSTTISKTNLDGSYSALLRAAQMLPKDHQIAAYSIQNAWLGLSWASTVDAWERPKPSAPLFESFVELGMPFGRPLDFAHLELHHPTTPSTDSAVRYLGEISLKKQEIISTILAQMQKDTPTIRDHAQTRLKKRLVCFTLDTMDRLKQAGDTTEASRVENFLTRLCKNLNLNFLNFELVGSLTSDRRFHRAFGID
ncbi:hypothetical protein SLS62_002398 [Diatrype stigma]|uniref:Uncharacterized protein n=1 Tax=Diatrype stigma TaxID=117547 RepID=A0AAN9UTZ2_9PEZI